MAYIEFEDVICGDKVLLTEDIYTISGKFEKGTIMSVDHFWGNGWILRDKDGHSAHDVHRRKFEKLTN